jgi:hypothetical protein
MPYGISGIFIIISEFQVLQMQNKYNTWHLGSMANEQNLPPRAKEIQGSRAP